MGDSTDVYQKLEYDHRTNVVYAVKYARHIVKNHRKYLSDIHVFNLTDKQESDIFNFSSVDIDDKIEVDFISLDWVTKNLCFTVSKAYKVPNVDDTSKNSKTLFSFKKENDFSVIKVFPNQGYLIVGVFSGKYTINLIIT